MNKFSKQSAQIIFFLVLSIYTSLAKADVFDSYFEEPPFGAETYTHPHNQNNVPAPKNNYTEYNAPAKHSINENKTSTIVLPKGADIFDAALNSYANVSQADIEFSLAEAKMQQEELAYNTQILWEVDAGFLHSRASDHSISKTVHNNDRVAKTSVSLTKTIWDSSLDLSIQSAKQDMQTTKFKQFGEQQQLIESVALIYLDYLAANEIATIAQQRTNLFSTIKKQINTKQNLGYAADIDVVEVEKQLQAAKISLISAQNDLQKTNINLRQLTENDSYHINAARSFSKKTNNIRIKAVPELINVALTNNTELSSLHSEQVALQKTIQSRRLETSPKFDLASSLSQSWKEGKKDQNSFDFSIGMKMKMPLYTGGRIANQIKQAKLELLHAERRSHKKRREIITQINIFSSDFSSSLSSYKSLLVLRKQVNKNIKLTKAAVPFGVRNSRHIYSALEDQFNLENALVRQFYDLLKIKVKIMKITGELDSNDLSQLRGLLNF